MYARVAITALFVYLQASVSPFTLTSIANSTFKGAHNAPPMSVHFVPVTSTFQPVLITTHYSTIPLFATLIQISCTVSVLTPVQTPTNSPNRLKNFQVSTTTTCMHFLIFFSLHFPKIQF